jgi:L-threonylcarbamoyladenylate synthase
VTPRNVVEVDPAAPDPAVLARAAALLRDGGLVAFPTETVYGLGAHALDPAAVRRIYAAKGRPDYNPLIVHVPDERTARALAAEWTPAARALAAAFWPGPLTLVVPRAAAVPASVTAGLGTVALRVPAHPVALALLRTAALPVAAPSANRSTAVSPTTAAHVVRSLGDRVDLVLDGGPCPVGIESTVLSLAGAVPTLLRPGSVTREEIAGVVGEVVDAPAPAAAAADAARPSPGMLDRHYAPDAEVVVYSRDARLSRLREAGAAAAAGRRVAVVARDAAEAPAGALAVAMPPDPAGYAARLYAVLHDLDTRGIQTVYVEAPPDTPGWEGVRDRLRRAATRAAAPDGD